MDTTVLQEKIASLTTAVSNDQTVLDSDQAALKQAQDELAEADLINTIETLTDDQVTAANAGLTADGSKISLVVAP